MLKSQVRYIDSRDERSLLFFLLQVYSYSELFKILGNQCSDVKSFHWVIFGFDFEI